MKKIRIAVTGAAGQIGYSLLFRLVSGEVFGKKAEIELSLIEVPQLLGALKGVVMELEDCAFSCLKKVLVTDQVEKGFEGADWAVLVGGVPRKAGMERGELLTINGSIFLGQGKAIDQYADKNCRVLVVGNPCNTNAYIVKSVCRRISEQNFFALTLLDQNRAVAQLAMKAGADVKSVSRLAVWGNHSATQYPDFDNALIDGKPVSEVIKDKQWLKTTFIETVQKRGAAIIEARGKSSAASAANAIIDAIKKVISPTPQGEFFSMAVASDGSYGIDKGLMFSFPIVSNGESWEIVKDIPLNAFSKQKIQESLEELKMEKMEVSRLFV
ncbi:MAG: malate dehydrogenase [Candidatus Omnitrophota bacterium]